MRPLRLLLLVALILALTPSAAAAADIRQGQDVVIGANETIDDDLYVVGGTISILGTVRGDVIAAGGTISIDGVVTGDLIAAANSIAIRGEIGGSVRAAGNTIVLDGRVAEDIVVGGNDLTVLGNGRVGRDVLVGSVTATLSGQIGRDVQAGGTDVKIDGRVGRDVLAQVDRLALTERAVIEGSLKYTSANEATIASGATVRGTTERTVPATLQPELTDGPAGLVLNWLRGLVGLLILGILVVVFFPGFSRRAGEALVRSPIFTLAIGALVLLGLPVLSIVFFIVGSLVGGWWLGLVALAAYVVLLALGAPVAAVGLGGALIRLTQRPAPVWLALIVGLVTLLLVALVPILGPVVIFLAILFGLGATTIAIVGGRRPEPAVA